MERSAEPAIVVSGVGHTYKGGTVALDDVSLEIGTGLFGLLGSNGAGKSTLMRIICTLLEPRAGSVTVHGLDVVRDRTRVRSLIGYLPQEFGVWRLHRTEEVLDTLAEISGMHDKKERRRRVAETLESVGLAEVAGKKVKKLSGGMLRRLGVAQALVHDPAVLVMDEPTVGLDPEERLRFRQLMADIGRNRTIILSTHIVADLGSSCSDLALIHAGRLEFRGSPIELVRRAEGKVFEVSLLPNDELALDPNFEIVARTSRDGKTVLRGVAAEGQAPAGSAPADNITLEEAYLAFTVDQGRELTEGQAAA